MDAMRYGAYSHFGQRRAVHHPERMALVRRAGVTLAGWLSLAFGILFGLAFVVCIIGG